MIDPTGSYEVCEATHPTIDLACGLSVGHDGAHFNTKENATIGKGKNWDRPSTRHIHFDALGTIKKAEMNWATSARRVVAPV